MFRDVFLSAVTAAEKAQGERVAAFLFRQVASERFAYQRGDRNAFTARHRMELVVHSFVDKERGPFHMMYSSIRLRPRPRVAQTPAFGVCGFCVANQKSPAADLKSAGLRYE